MRKFIDFVKKPLLFISAGVFAAFTILLIIISCLPKGTKYEYSFSTMGVTMEVDYTFKGKELTLDMYIMGEYSTAKTEYKINKGDLYVVNVESNEWEFVGEINAYEIVMEADAEETGIGNMQLVLECKANKAIRTVAIVFMSISGVIAAACVAIYFLDKKGLLKFADSNVETAVETTESVETIAENTEFAEQESELAEEQLETIEEAEVQEDAEKTE